MSKPEESPPPPSPPRATPTVALTRGTNYKAQSKTCCDKDVALTRRVPVFVLLMKARACQGGLGLNVGTPPRPRLALIAIQHGSGKRAASVNQDLVQARGPNNAALKPNNLWQCLFVSIGSLDFISLNVRMCCGAALLVECKGAWLRRLPSPSGLIVWLVMSISSQPRTALCTDVGFCPSQCIVHS